MKRTSLKPPHASNFHVPDPTPSPRRSHELLAALLYERFLLFPPLDRPDTETPGFEHENLSKPSETAAMVPVDIYPADKVARTLLRGM